MFQTKKSSRAYFGDDAMRCDATVMGLEQAALAFARRLSPPLSTVVST